MIKTTQCVLTWWKTTMFLTLWIIVAIWTNVWIPLWLFPVMLWVIGLFIATRQAATEQSKSDKVIPPSERARLLQEENKVSDKLQWDKIQIFYLHGRRFPCGFTKPFDSRITDAMSRAVADTTETFNASTGYTFGQRAYFLFSPQQVIPERLRTCSTKVEAATAIASFMTLRTVEHLRMMKYSIEERELKNDLGRRCAIYYVGNGFSVDKQKDALNYFMNANLKECAKYGIWKLASMHFVPSEIKGLTNKEMITMLEKKRGISWAKQPNSIKYGIFTKRIKDVDKLESDKLNKSPLSGDDLIDSLKEELYDPKKRVHGKLSLLVKSLEFNYYSVDFLFKNYVENDDYEDEENDENKEKDINNGDKNKNGKDNDIESIKNGENERDVENLSNKKESKKSEIDDEKENKKETKDANEGLTKRKTDKKKN